MQQLQSSNTEHSLAVVIGANGGLGSALLAEFAREKLFARFIGFSRKSTPSLDLLSEASIVECARHIGAIGSPRLVIDATGFLYDAEVEPEKSLRQLTPEHLAKAFAVNAIGPALLMKHFLPLMPRRSPAPLSLPRPRKSPSRCTISCRHRPSSTPGAPTPTPASWTGPRWRAAACMSIGANRR